MGPGSGSEVHRKEAERLFINFAYYIGVLPFYTDMYFVTHHVTSAIHLIRYGFTISVVIFVETLILARLGWDIVSQNFKMGREDDMIRLCYALVIGATMVAHLNTLWHQKKIVELMNNFNAYRTKILGFWDTDRERANIDGFVRILKYFFIACTSIPFLGTLVYFVRCNWHLFFPILPICACAKVGNSGVISWNHGAYAKIPGYGALMSIGLSYTLGGAYVYIILSFEMLCAGMDMYLVLLSTSKHSYFARHSNWTKHYRALSILFIHLNGIIQEVMLPLAIAGLPSVIITLNFILIRTRENIFMLCCLAYIDILTTIILILVFHQGTNVVLVFKTALERKKCLARSKLCKANLRGLPIVKLAVGSLCYIDKETRVMTFRVVADQTFALLIAFK